MVDDAPLNPVSEPTSSVPCNNASISSCDKEPSLIAFSSFYFTYRLIFSKTKAFYHLNSHFTADSARSAFKFMFIFDFNNKIIVNFYIIKLDKIADLKRQNISYLYFNHPDFYNNIDKNRIQS